MRCVLCLFALAACGRAPSPDGEQQAATHAERVVVHSTDATSLPSDASAHDEPVTAALSRDPCTDAIHEPAWFPPVLADDAPERAWTLGRRTQILQHECSHGWNDDLLACLRDATDPSGIDTCLRAGLALHELRNELTAVDKLATKIATARKQPATLTCKRVVATHYADASWRGKLDGFAPAERKRMINASRTRMLDACTSATWDETLRACIIVGGGQPCFESARMTLAWGYPAAGTVTSVGVADCDAYGAAVAALVKCDKLPAESRESMVRSYEAKQAHIAAQPAADRQKLAPGCRAGLDAVKQIAASVGC